MIDYENLLKDFIGEVIAYLTRSLKKSKDNVDYRRTVAEIEKLKVIKSCPFYYADYNVRVKNNLVVEGRSQNFVDSGVFHLFRNVIFVARDLNSGSDFKRQEAQKLLLDAYKRIKLINAKNAFERIKFNLLSSEKIAMKSNQR